MENYIHHLHHYQENKLSAEIAVIEVTVLIKITSAETYCY